MLELDILGPLILRSGDRPAGLRPMERVLLLALYCADGNPLSPQRLAALLWERPADHSPVTLRRHIAGARKAAAGEVVVTRRQGSGATSYILGIAAERIDAVRFRRQVSDGCGEYRLGRYEESADRLGRALALWRGAPLADAARRPFARTQITRLRNTHRVAVVTRLKAGVSLGQHREATGDLEALTAIWPEDGEVWRLLITCLYRSERPMEAARACRQAIGALRDQGLDDRAMRELQHDTLTGALPMHGPVPAVPEIAGRDWTVPEPRYPAPGTSRAGRRETWARSAEVVLWSPADTARAFPRRRAAGGGEQSRDAGRPAR